MKRYSRLFALLAILLPGITWSQAITQKITITIAGSGVAGYTGDGGSARLAQISGPKDICMDAAENIYFVDRGNGVIRRVDKATNIITTVAGGGSSLADGIPATNASISPNYLCISTTGDIYFTTGHTVRRISAVTHLINTVAGSATAGYGGDGGPAVAATLNNPQGIAIDRFNNVYVVDRGNQRVRKIAAGTITTIAGTGTVGTTGDGGPATAATLNFPVCVCVNGAGDVFFSDRQQWYPAYDNSVIRKIGASTGNVDMYAGIGMVNIYDVPAMSALLGTITGMCIQNDTGDLYCNEMSCSCRRICHRNDSIYEVGGNFAIQSFTDDIASSLGDMNIPYGLCVDRAGAVYVADSNNQRIRKIIPVTSTPAFAFGRGQYINPVAGTPWPLDSLLWVSDIDSGQTETWTVIQAPMHGTLSGFPATALSNGMYRTTKPTGLSYSGTSGYTGPDFFRVRISDPGGLADTVTVYVGTNLVSLSTNQLSQQQPSMDIFPNPAASTVTIAWAGMPAMATEIEITDIANRLMYKATADARGKGIMQVDVSSFPAGLYMVRMGGTEVRKFVKQ